MHFLALLPVCLKPVFTLHFGIQVLSFNRFIFFPLWSQFTVRNVDVKGFFLLFVFLTSSYGRRLMLEWNSSIEWIIFFFGSFCNFCINLNKVWSTRNWTNNMYLRFITQSYLIPIVELHEKFLCWLIFKAFFFKEGNFSCLQLRFSFYAVYWAICCINLHLFTWATFCV